MPRRNILLAMFDVKPTGKSAGLVLSRIRREINLYVKKKATETIKKPKTIIESPPPPLEDNYWEELIAKLPQRPDFPAKYELTTFSKAAILKELEKTISEPVNLAVELASVGGQVHSLPATKPRVKVAGPKRTDNFESPAKGYEVVNLSGNPALASQALKDFWVSVEAGAEPIPDLIKADTHAHPIRSRPAEGTTTTASGRSASNGTHSPASREIEVWLENIQKNRQLLSAERKPSQKPRSIFRIKPKWSSWFRFNRKAMIYLLVVSLSGATIWGAIDQQGITAKKNIVQNGSNAVANLEEAKRELENFNFLKAADSFALAYDDLNKASGTLNQLGSSFLAVFGNLPGLSKVRAASNLVEAGQSLSKAGENLSLAFGTIYQTNLFSFLDTKASGQAGGASISKLLTEFKNILNFADKNINRADRLLADIDVSLMPPDKQQLFLDFKEKIPEFQKYIGEAVDYSDFLLKLVGDGGAKTYLVLLQNNSELRPTGGFPGSYALITFEDGALKKIFVDDIYRADAGLKENIIPPIPLQHITPNWGARDANWFADFPLSARKVMEFYELGGGPRVDGVLTINPDIIARIFEIIGPIEMPEYGVTLNANNFLAEIQSEVEYEADRSAPKQILSDLQPKFFERLARQDKDRWLSIFKIISEAAEQKHILAYFENRELETMAVKNGLGGEIKSGPSTGLGQADYLQVVFANVKGSKTDFVTENSMDLTVEANNENGLEHTLKISRVHNGGDSKYGFYNRDNSAYIKVYVAAGSVLEGIQGQSITDYRSLIGHEDFGFRKDPDLERIEATISRPFAGVDVFEESGKTVFGFWLVTKPKQTKSVTLKYLTPTPLVNSEYNLLWQKQSGTGNDRAGFSFKLPEGKGVINQSADLQTIGDNLVWNSDLSVDRKVDIEFR